MGNKQQKTSNQKEEDPKEIKQPHPDQPSKAPQIQQQPKPCKPLRHYSPVHIIKLQSQTMITGQNGIDLQTEIENQNKMRLVIKDSIE